MGTEPRQQVRHCGVLAEMGHFHGNLCCLGSVRGRRGLPGAAPQERPSGAAAGRCERGEGLRGRAPRVCDYCAFPTSDCAFPTSISPARGLVTSLRQGPWGRGEREDPPTQAVLVLLN